MSFGQSRQHRQRAGSPIYILSCCAPSSFAVACPALPVSLPFSALKRALVACRREHRIWRGPQLFGVGRGHTITAAAAATPANSAPHSPTLPARSPLHDAAQAGDAELIRQLLTPPPEAKLPPADDMADPASACLPA